ncbi:MAG: DNA polymerase-3 subunit beta [Planctomycetota bacterium]|jgi:DNA polymerase-3 subunit beta
MKIICDRDKLREGLAIAAHVIPKSSTKPAVQNVCLVATDNALEIVGTDLEVSIRYRLEGVEVIEPGPALIPARVATDFVRDLSEETVTIETIGNKCFITSGTDKCELVTVDPDEFPVIARFTGRGTVSMQGGTFSKLVSQTAFAAAREPGRYAMHGVLTEIENDTLRMIATDGRRLALATTPAECLETPAPVIIPTKGLQLFCRAITDPLDQIALSIEENQVGLRTKNAEIFARVIDGEFPRYSAVIPDETTNRMEADPVLLSKKLRLVANVTGDEARAVRLKLENNKLEIFGRSAGRGEATAHMDVEFNGSEADIAFNPDFVLDGLKNCEAERVFLEFNERTSPGKFLLGENHIYIVMPITVDAQYPTPQTT